MSSSCSHSRPDIDACIFSYEDDGFYCRKNNQNIFYKSQEAKKLGFVGMPANDWGQLLKYIEDLEEIDGL